MKKFLLIAVAAFGMLMTACSKDEVAQPVGGEESIVTFTVEAPVMQTRATEHGDGKTATELTVLVYQRGGALLFEKEAEMEDLKATVELPFVNGMEYDLVFWAEAENSPYELNKANKTVGYTNANALKSNSQAYDAFYAYVNDIPVITGPVTRKVELKRPFAQLNIITNDYAEAEQSGVIVEEVAVTVKNGYTAFDFVYGNGIEQGNVTFGSFAKQSNTTLAVNYLFTGGEKSLVDVEFSYTDVEDKVSDEGRTMEFAAVPVQRNYRTNIVGSLLTSEGKFNIETKPGFATEEHNVEVVTVTSATELVDEITNGDADQIILTGDINLNDLLGRAADNDSLIIPADRTVTLNLGGFTLSHAKTQTAAFNMIQNQGTLTIENGTVSYADNGNGGNYVSNTIQNSGVLTLKDVTVVNNSSNGVATNGYPHPVDNSGKLIVEKGTVLTNNTNYSSMRIWCTEDTDTEVIINGGTFNGSIDFQTVSAKPNKGILTINDGTFNADTYTKSAVRLLGFGTDVDEMVATINGGIFNGLIKRGKYVDGEFNSQVFFVKGGTFNDASVFEFLADGAEIALSNDIETSKTITLVKSVKINGNNNTITSTADRLFNIDANNINVEINDIDMYAAYERTGTNDVRGINILPNHSGINLTINNSTVRFKAPYGCDWAYAINQTNGNTGNSITVNGGEFEGANVFNLWGAGNNTYNIDGAKITSLYPINPQYYGYGIIVWSNSSTNINNTVSITNCSFDGKNAEAISVYDHENRLTLENNTDNTTKATFITTTEALEKTGGVLKSGTVLALNGAEYNGKITAEGDLTIMGDTKIKTLQAVNGGTITIEDGKTLTLSNFSFGSKDTAGKKYEIKGGTVVAGYGFFQHGTYALRSNFKTGYMYYSYGSDITVYGTFHSEGKGDGLDYVRGKLTIATGGKSIHDKSLWIGQPANWGAMEASMTIEDGGYVQANSLSVYEGSSLTYHNDADLKYNTVSGAEYIIKK